MREPRVCRSRQGVSTGHARASPCVLACGVVSTPADELPIEPRGPLDAQLEVPGSKSLTNRALVAAALARGRSQLHGALESDDTQVMRRALRALGIAVDDPAGKPWTVEGQSGQLQEPADTLWMGGSGTSARFLTAAATLCNGPVSLDGDARMRERPIGDLTEALQKLGAGRRFNNITVAHG